MACGHDHVGGAEGMGSGGGGFLLGLLTGAFVGAALGVLFAPKPGAELRKGIADQAQNAAHTATEGYQKASATASEWVDKSRSAYEKARVAVVQGAGEVQRFVSETRGEAAPGNGGSRPS